MTDDLKAVLPSDLPPSVERRVEQIVRESGYEPCQNKDCPYCLRGLQRKCPDQDSWDCALGLADAAYRLGQAEARTPVQEP